jgi:hypothetical protein
MSDGVPGSVADHVKRVLRRLEPRAQPREPLGPESTWAALRMIREVIETLGPPGVLISEEAVLQFYGPEPVHEAQAICDALSHILTGDGPSS